MKLGTKAALFGSVLVFIALINLFFHHQTARIEQQSTRMLTSADALLRELSELQNKANAYGENAPRDYQSYYRDVALFNEEFEVALASLKASDQQISLQLEAINSGSLLLQLSADELLAQRLSWGRKFTVFLRNYYEALGDDKGEPRLEWAAKVIREQAEELLLEATGLAQRASEFNLQRQNKQESVALFLALAVIFVSLSLSIWFYVSIVKPVKTLAKTTNLVAQGDFGLQLESKGADEISEVTSAFNSLSIRIDLILKLLDQLEEGVSEQQAVDAVVGICGEYFNVDWVGMIALESCDTSLRLKAASPQQSLKRWFAKTAVIDDGNLAHFMSRHIIEDKLWLEPDIDKFSLQIKDSRLMRELMRNTHAHSVLGIPLLGADERRGMLLLASKSQGLLDGKRGELLMKLTPLISQRVFG